MNEAIETHFPKVIKKVYTSDRPWITPKIKKKLIHTRHNTSEGILLR